MEHFIEFPQLNYNPPIYLHTKLYYLDIKICQGGSFEQIGFVYSPNSEMGGDIEKGNIKLIRCCPISILKQS